MPGVSYQLTTADADKHRAGSLSSSLLARRHYRDFQHTTQCENISVICPWHPKIQLQIGMEEKETKTSCPICQRLRRMVQMVEETTCRKNSPKKAPLIFQNCYLSFVPEDPEADPPYLYQHHPLCEQTNLLEWGGTTSSPLLRYSGPMGRSKLISQKSSP